MDQVRPVRNLRPKVFLNAIECTSELPAIRGSTVLRTHAIAWKPMPYFRFGNCGVQLALELGERPIRKPCPTPQSTLRSEWSIENFIQVHAVTAGRQQLPYFIITFCVKLQFSHEIFGVWDVSHAKYSVATPLTSYFPKHSYLPAVDSTYSLVSNRSSIEPPISSDRGTLSSSTDCGYRSRSFPSRTAATWSVSAGSKPSDRTAS